MALPDLIFYLFALVAVVSALVVASTRNLMRAAFALMFAFFGVAGLYVLLNADFLAVTQILVYIGGILVLLLFGIMLTNRQVSVDVKTGVLQTLPASILAAALAGSMFGIFWNTHWFNGGAVRQSIDNTTPELGRLLLSDFLLPFEVASVVLLVAMVGAAMIARKVKA